jgi:uncharacterized protein YabN with tetrapyrrole methylase and pyrophosphatase domain
MLDGVSKGLPAIMEAFQMTTKVSRVGFDGPGPAGADAKLDEEIAELREARSRQPADPPAVQEEIGDLFFVLVNLARLLGVDPESALKGANRKFRRRFRYIEDRLREGGRTPADSNLEEMDAFWNEAKAAEKAKA